MILKGIRSQWKIKAGAHDLIFIAISCRSQLMPSNSRIWQVDASRVKQLGDAADQYPLAALTEVRSDYFVHVRT
jgi:hypothetical protein